MKHPTPLFEALALKGGSFCFTIKIWAINKKGACGLEPMLRFEFKCAERTVKKPI